MRINWILASDYQLDPNISVEAVKAVGPVWGSHKTWRNANTDNVICHDLTRARQLIDRAFQAVCNFYVPKKFFVDLGRPLGAKLYEGDFDQSVQDIEDIIAMHLAARSSDIVLLLGFDLDLPDSIPDKLQAHEIKHRHGLMRSAMAGNPDVQWVLLDRNNMHQSYKELPNLTCDTIQNALKLLI